MTAVDDRDALTKNNEAVLGDMDPEKAIPCIGDMVLAWQCDTDKGGCGKRRACNVHKVVVAWMTGRQYMFKCDCGKVNRVYNPKAKQQQRIITPENAAAEAKATSRVLQMVRGRKRT